MSWRQFRAHTTIWLKPRFIRPSVVVALCLPGSDHGVMFVHMVVDGLSHFMRFPLFGVVAAKLGRPLGIVFAPMLSSCLCPALKLLLVRRLAELDPHRCQHHLFVALQAFEGDRLAVGNPQCQIVQGFGQHTLNEVLGCLEACQKWLKPLEQRADRLAACHLQIELGWSTEDKMRVLKSCSVLAAAFEQLWETESIACFHRMRCWHEFAVEHLQARIPVAGVFLVDSRVECCYAHDFAFYTAHDIEYATKSGVLFLSYGSLNSEACDGLIGATVTQHLQKHGLPVSWSGSSWHRLEIRLHFQDLLLLHFFSGGGKGVADFHRKACVFRALRAGLAALRKESLQLCFEAWALQPGIALCKRARVRFDGVHKK